MIYPHPRQEAFASVATDCDGLYKASAVISQEVAIRLTFPGTVLIYWVLHGTNFYDS
jgi:hypothetical protein